MVASGSDAETAGRLSATPHHQKRPAQVCHAQIRCMEMQKCYIVTANVGYRNYFVSPPQWFLWEFSTDAGGGGSSDRRPAGGPERHRRQPVCQRRGPGLSGNSCSKTEFVHLTKSKLTLKYCLHLGLLSALSESGDVVVSIVFTAFFSSYCSKYCCIWLSICSMLSRRVKFMLTAVDLFIYCDFQEAELSVSSCYLGMKQVESRRCGVPFPLHGWRHYPQ